MRSVTPSLFEGRPPWTPVEKILCAYHGCVGPLLRHTVGTWFPSVHDLLPRRKTGVRLVRLSVQGGSRSHGSPTLGRRVSPPVGLLRDTFWNGKRGEVRESGRGQGTILEGLVWGSTIRIMDPPWVRGRPREREQTEGKEGDGRGGRRRGWRETTGSIPSDGLWFFLDRNIFDDTES